MSNKWYFELKELLNSLREAQVYFSVFQDVKGELKVVHSGMNEEMYALMQTVLHRNIEVFDFMKLSLVNAEKFREEEMNEAFALMTRAVEYIHIKNPKTCTYELYRKAKRESKGRIEPCIKQALIIEFEQLPEHDKYNFYYYDKEKDFLLYCQKCEVYKLIPGD